MANGEAWQDWINRAAACPNAWPFETLLVLPGGEVFLCKDHLAARFSEGWIDLLLSGAPPVPYGTWVDVKVYFP